MPLSLYGGTGLALCLIWSPQPIARQGHDGLPGFAPISQSPGTPLLPWIERPPEQVRALPVAPGLSASAPGRGTPSGAPSGVFTCPPRGRGSLRYLA